MSDANAARRYAAALVDLAVSLGEADKVEKDLQRLTTLFAGEGSELFEALCAPIFSVEERGSVLTAIVPRLGLSDLTRRFLGLLSERERMVALPAISKIFTERMDAIAGRVRVVVSTVEPLTPTLEAEIRAVFEKATGKSVVLDARIDPSLIGGLVARIGGRVYDASIKRRLEDIKQRLIHSQATPEA